MKLFVKLLFVSVIFTIKTQSVMAGQCAVVKDENQKVLRSFCSKDLGNRYVCSSTNKICDDSTFDNLYHSDSKRPPWYQAALDWAAKNSGFHVYYEKGTIDINRQSKIPGEWPFNDGVGIRVAPGISVHGSTDTLQPTIFRVADQTNLWAIVLVSKLPEAQYLQRKSEVDNLVLVGVSDSSAAKGLDCPNLGAKINSLADMPNHPVANIKEIKTKTYYGVLVDGGIPNALPVDLHHLKVTHVAQGTAHGWNTNVVPEVESCETNICAKLRIVDAATGNCQNSDYGVELQLPGDARQKPYCVFKKNVSNLCQPKYCPSQPHEFLGHAKFRSKVYNNTLCDAYFGIGFGGGNLDGYHNAVLRPMDTPVQSGVALGSDGHIPYTSNTSWTKNFVQGYNIAALTDGSQYLFVSQKSFENIFGYKSSDFVDYQDYLDLLQILLDMGSAHFAKTDPYRGYVDHVYINENRFFQPVNSRPIVMYRANWAFIGHNEIIAPQGSHVAIALENTLNSWVYGNKIEGVNIGISETGLVGVQSKWGSCYNGIGSFFDESNRTFTNIANDISANQCKILKRANHCFEGAPSQDVCQR